MRNGLSLRLGILSFLRQGRDLLMEELLRPNPNGMAGAVFDFKKRWQEIMGKRIRRLGWQKCGKVINRCVELMD